MIKFEVFQKTDFYKKYQNDYVGKKILKDYYNKSVPNDVYPRNRDSYEKVYHWNLQVLRDILTLKSISDVNDEDLWSMAFAVYKDPDGYDIKQRCNIDCTADGLLSIKRIYTVHGFNEQMIQEYEIYRKQAIIHFPRERNGVNMSRAFIFGDRIDSTLLDLKNYYDNNKLADSCRLKNAFKLPKTSVFLQSFDDFASLVDWLGIRGSFVNDANEIFDLEKGKDNILTNYHLDTSWKWSDNYYQNVKLAIDQYSRQ